MVGWSQRIGAAVPAEGLAWSGGTPYLGGLLVQADRKKSWQLADAIGVATPHGFQRMLGRARWDTDRARNDLVWYVAEQLGEIEVLKRARSPPSRVRC